MKHRTGSKSRARFARREYVRNGKPSRDPAEPSRRSPRASRPESSGDRALSHELAGLGLIALSVIIVVSGISGTGAASLVIQKGLHFVVGRMGAWLIALGLVILGVRLLVRRQPVRATTTAIGFVLIFWVLLGMVEIWRPRTAFMDRSLPFAAEPGGVMGVALAWLVRMVVPPLPGTLLLFLLAVGALTMMSDTPLVTVVRQAGAGLAGMIRRGTEGASETRRRHAQRRKVLATDMQPRRPTAPPERKRERPMAPPVREPEPTPPAPPPPTPSPAAEAEKPKRGTKRAQLDFAHDLTTGSGNYKLPPLSLLAEVKSSAVKQNHQESVDKMEILERTFRSFGIDAKVVEIERGPRVTRYEIQPPPGVRVSRITNLADDLALSLSALDVRVEAPVPGKGVIGIEVPNVDVVFVHLKEILESEEMRRNPSKLAFALGRDISGHPRVADLAKMPHLLIAGATNSGKSVCLNAMIASILFRATPDEVRFLMVDPKRVELSLFDKIPHLVYPVAYNVKEVKGLLLWAIKEMERRYEMFAATGVRNIYGYKEQRTIDGEMENLPFIVIVIDELADLMMQAASEFETAICRIAQLARATGIHLVVATQRPSVNVITGTIKANIASRVAFAVASQVDSRTILDMNGAERLVGSGDMLYLPIDASKPTRIQGAYISEADTGRLADYLREQGEPQYCAEPVEVEGKTNGGGSDESVDDDLFAKALEYVLATKYASASMLQRKLRVGYTRAARLIDMMEERGYIGPHEGSKARQVYAQPIRGIDDDDAPPLRTARVMGAEADADDEEPPALSVDEVEEETDDR